MQTLLNRHMQLTVSKLANLPVGKEVGLVELFGEDWERIGGPGDRKTFGKEFKAAVAANNFPGVRWVRIENNGRYDVYVKDA